MIEIAQIIARGPPLVLVPEDDAYNPIATMRKIKKIQSKVNLV